MSASSDSEALPVLPQGFRTTHWSVILTAADPNSSEAQVALETLCRTYWRPLYCFVRRNGRSESDAQDLTQEFFTALLAKNKLRLADRDRGKFRTFLLTALKNFMIDEWEKTQAQKRGGGVTFISFDDPELPEVADLNMDPERGYDRQWAMTVLSEARRLLQQEHAASDHADYLQALTPCVFIGGSKCNYPELAAHFHKSQVAVRKDVERIRKRHRELLRQAVAHTVAVPPDIDAELRHLFSVVNQ